MVGLTIGTLRGLVATTGSAGFDGGCGGSGVEQAASNPRIDAAQARRRRPKRRRTFDMWVIFLEAFGAVVLLVLIVWWTMFHGRRNGERADDPRDDA
jgi:F0F1-type ATP synthase membrane subunit c/vacuolar-type H+-ATPase subunit K